MSRTAPAGGTCGAKACWKVDDTKDTYHDRDATPDGLTEIELTAEDVGRGRLVARGKGSSLGVPSGGFTPPLIVRLIRNDAPVCRKATYSTPTVNNGVKFRAKSD